MAFKIGLKWHKWYFKPALINLDRKGQNRLKVCFENKSIVLTHDFPYLLE